jgi:hypothetical protein
MSFLYLALVWLTGFSLVRLFFPSPLRWSLHNAFLLSLGAGVGIGIASSIYFVTLALAGPKPVVIAAVEAAVAAVIVAAGMLAKPRGVTLEFGPGPASPSRLTWLILLAAAAAAAMFIVYSLYKPHGEWDAWSVWNMRARFLFRGGDAWRQAFSSRLAWSHPDYPLMLPGIVALSWTLARAESTWPQVLVALLFTSGAAGLFIVTLGVLRGKAQAFVAGSLLLGTVAFVQIGAMQYADVPLSFFILATLALLCLQDRYPGVAGLSILAGITAGFSAWTKNEGLLFVAVVIVARALVLFRFHQRARVPRELLSLIAGAAAPLAVVAFFKLRFAPPSDMLSAKPSQILSRLIDPARWIATIEGFVKAAFTFGNFLIPIVLVLVLYWYLVRFRVEAGDRLALATVLTPLVLMLAGDLAVYILLPPQNLDWRINTSVDRILLQLWPGGLLAFFLAAAPLQLVTVKEVVERAKPAKRAPKATRRAAGTH